MKRCLLNNSGTAIGTNPKVTKATREKVHFWTTSLVFGCQEGDIFQWRFITVVMGTHRLPLNCPHWNQSIYSFWKQIYFQGYEVFFLSVLPRLLAWMYVALKVHAGAARGSALDFGSSVRTANLELQFNSLIFLHYF